MKPWNHLVSSLWAMGLLSPTCKTLRPFFDLRHASTDLATSSTLQILYNGDGINLV